MFASMLEVGWRKQWNANLQDYRGPGQPDASSRGWQPTLPQLPQWLQQELAALVTCMTLPMAYRISMRQVLAALQHAATTHSMMQLLGLA